MFRKRNEPAAAQPTSTGAGPTERITSVLGNGVVWQGRLSGSGGVRIEGIFEGEVALRGVLVIGETGRVTCDHLRAQMVVVAGMLRGDVTAEKVEIRSSGRVWGNVVTAAFATEEGAFLRGQIRMEEKVDVGLGAADSESPNPESLPAATNPE